MTALPTAQAQVQVQAQVQADGHQQIGLAPELQR